eukprot:c24218_g10_i1 orf=269-1045(+)
MALGTACAHQASLQSTLPGTLDAHGHSSFHPIILSETRALTCHTAQGKRCLQVLGSIGDSLSVLDGASMSPIILMETHALTCHSTQERRSLQALGIGDSLAALEGASMPPSIDDCISLLQTCRKLKNSMHADHMHMHIYRSGLECQKDLGNYLIPMFVECGKIRDAEKLFHRMLHRNEHSWTSLIQGYLDFEEPNHAFTLFQKMQEECVQPSKHTFVALINACAKLKNLERGQEMHAEIAKEGFETFPYVGNSLVDMY